MPENLLPPHLNVEESVPFFMRVLNQIGMPPELVEASWDKTQIMSLMFQELTDGEIAFDDPMELDPLRAEWYGPLVRSEGQLITRFKGERESPDSPVASDIEYIERYLARLAAHATAIGEDSTYNMNGFRETTKVDGAKVQAFGSVLDLGEPVHSVLQYGPSFNGQHYIDRQLTMMANDEEPFMYIPVARRPFIAEYLKRYLQYNLLPPTADYDAFERYVQSSMLLPKENGMAAASTELVEEGEWIEAIDVVACSGLYTAKAEDMQVGLVNAHRLLRSGGALALANPASAPNPGDLAAEQVFAMAEDVGFHWATEPRVLITIGDNQQVLRWIAAVLVKQ